MLGICFGSQILADVLGGEVRPADRPEIGWTRVDTVDPDQVEAGPWLVWHFDVLTTPPGAEALARTGHGTQAFRRGRHLGVQFHPEATPDNVASWARTYADPLRTLGLTPDGIVEETRRRLEGARRRAHTLFDRVLDRSVRPAAERRPVRSAPRER